MLLQCWHSPFHFFLLYQTTNSIRLYYPTHNRRKFRTKLAKAVVIFFSSVPLTQFDNYQSHFQSKKYKNRQKRPNLGFIHQNTTFYKLPTFFSCTSLLSSISFTQSPFIPKTLKDLVLSPFSTIINLMIIASSI